MRLVVFSRKRHVHQADWNVSEALFPRQSTDNLKILDIAGVGLGKRRKACGVCIAAILQPLIGASLRPLNSQPCLFRGHQQFANTDRVVPLIQYVLFSVSLYLCSLRHVFGHKFAVTPVSLPFSSLFSTS